MFSYEIYKIFKNTYFEEHLRMTASDTIHILMQYTNNIYEHDTIKYYIAYKLNTKLFYFGRLYEQLLKIKSWAIKFIYVMQGENLESENLQSIDLFVNITLQWKDWASEEHIYQNIIFFHGASKTEINWAWISNIYSWYLQTNGQLHVQS